MERITEKEKVAIFKKVTDIELKLGGDLTAGFNGDIILNDINEPINFPDELFLYGNLVIKKCYVRNMPDYLNVAVFFQIENCQCDNSPTCLTVKDEFSLKDTDFDGFPSNFYATGLFYRK